MALRLVVRHPNSASGEAGAIHFEFEQARVVIGRGPGADVRLPGLTVSDTHAVILREGEHYAVRDEGSTNGTQVNDKPLVPRRARVLSDGDELTIAEFTLEFSEGSFQRGATLPERTASLARRMMRELMGDEHASSEPPFLRRTEGDDAGELLQLGEPPARLLIQAGDVAAELLRDPDGTIARALERGAVDINGKRMRERRLRHGDVLRVGDQVLLYQDPAERALRELERQPDVRFIEPRTVPAQVPLEAPPPEPEAEPAEPESDPAPDSTPVDLVIYGLAGLVLLTSVIGLIWLFR